MAEAQPSRRRGGHAYGRRHLNLSNTAEAGELCIYCGHGIGRYSDSSMRYDSHAACVRCVAGAREGRLSFDIDRLLVKHRKRALKFWSQVDMGAPDECWNWNGCVSKSTGQPQFAWRRAQISSSTQHHPQRVAMWFTWGDLGFSGVKTTCGNRFCCNPFHLIPQKVGVFVDHDSYGESFELACELHTLKQQISEYVIAEAIRQQEKEEAAAGESRAVLLGPGLEQLSAEAAADREAMLLDPEAVFGDKFEALMLDVLAGRHASQIKPADHSLLGNPIDEIDIEEPDDPTNDY